MVLEGYVVCIIYQDIDLINQVQAWCATVIDEEREWQDRDECGPGCPILAEAWKTDDTLRVSQSLDQEEIMVALKDRYPAFSLVELLQYCALIGRELQSVEIFSCNLL